MSRILVFFVFFSILAGTSYYLAYRLYDGLAVLFPGMRFWPMLVIIGILAVILILGFVRALTPFPKEVKRILGLLSGYCMGIAFYLLLFTVAADLVLLIPRLMKLPFTANPLLKSAETICILVLTFGTSIYGFFHAKQISHISYEIQLQDKNDISDLNMVLISDLHLGAIGSERQLEKIVNEINAQQPDVVCIAGDFFDTDFEAIQDPDAALQTLQKLHATYGVYTCLGNHDGGQTLPQMLDFLNQADIQLLNDTYTVIDDRLILVGRLDTAAIGGYGDQARKPLSDFFIRENPSVPVIVLDHDPANISEYSTEADLLLCGHTHRGHIFPINLFTKLMYTVDYGHYQKDAQSPQVIVTSGVGIWGMPMRVGTDCEVVTIHFSGK